VVALLRVCLRVCLCVCVCVCEQHLPHCQAGRRVCEAWVALLRVCLCV
jgi:hypothetical protein